MARARNMAPQGQQVIAAQHNWPPWEHGCPSWLAPQRDAGANSLWLVANASRGSDAYDVTVQLFAGRLDPPAVFRCAACRGASTSSITLSDASVFKLPSDLTSAHCNAEIPFRGQFCRHIARLPVLRLRRVCHTSASGWQVYCPVTHAIRGVAVHLCARAQGFIAAQSNGVRGHTRAARCACWVRGRGGAVGAWVGRHRGF